MSIDTWNGCAPRQAYQYYPRYGRSLATLNKTADGRGQQIPDHFHRSIRRRARRNPAAVLLSRVWHWASHRLAEHARYNWSGAIP
jgi:hypothetical protein